jgi:hypothetical protein
MAVKDHPENSPEGQKAKADAVNADAKVASGPQEVLDRETAQGFRGDAASKAAGVSQR